MGCMCLILMLDSVYRMSTPNIEFSLFNVQTSEKDNSIIHNVDGISEKITITF